MVTPKPGIPEPTAEPFFSNDEGKEEIAAELDAQYAAGGADDVPAQEPAAPRSPPLTSATPGAPPQAVPGTPPAAEAPAPTIPPPPPIDAATRARIAYLEGIERQHLEQQLRQQVEGQVQQYQRELEADGLLPEQAQRIASRHRQTILQQQQQAQQFQQQLAYDQGKRNAAQHFSEKYGVPPSSLMQYDSPQAMEAAAAQAKRVKDLEDEVKKLKQGTVVPQRFDAGRGTPRATNTNRSKTLEEYNTGKRKLTTEEAKKLGII